MRNKKFAVKFRGKTFHYNGASCSEVAEKFGNRKVYGTPWIFRLSLRQYDAATRGERWAVYATEDGERVEIDAVGN